MITALLFAVYAAASAALLIYGANCYILVVLFLRRHRRRAAESAAIIARAHEYFDEPARLPQVASQIPLYNEANVAERAIRATAAIDYPIERHEIQVPRSLSGTAMGIMQHGCARWVSRR